MPARNLSSSRPPVTSKTFESPQSSKSFKPPSLKNTQKTSLKTKMEGCRLRPSEVWRRRAERRPGQRSHNTGGGWGGALPGALRALSSRLGRVGGRARIGGCRGNTLQRAMYASRGAPSGFLLVRDLGCKGHGTPAWVQGLTWSRRPFQQLGCVRRSGVDSLLRPSAPMASSFWACLGLRVAQSCNRIRWPCSSVGTTSVNRLRWVPFGLGRAEAAGTNKREARTCL